MNTLMNKVTEIEQSSYSDTFDEENPEEERFNEKRNEKATKNQHNGERITLHVMISGIMVT